MILEDRFQFTPDLQINRLLNRMWQVSGAHGRIEPKSALASIQYWDLADHDGPAEDLIEFRRLLQTKGQEASIQLQAFTKSRSLVEKNMIGARLGVTEHIKDNARVFEFKLDSEDYARLESVFNQSRDLCQLIGDCGDEYRR